MNSIYHEKQEGSLCGLHCLNNLLQGDFFTVNDLGVIAEKLDMREREQMDNDQTSVNVDDSGMFGIQVLSEALEQLNLSLIPILATADIAISARKDPVNQKAFICNFREHWFTIRKIGYQWFNLNSLLAFPELISDTYLSLFLKQLQCEGYFIFIVEGQQNLPHCEADEILLLNPVIQNVRPQLLSELRVKKESDLEVALAASLEKANQKLSVSQSEEDLKAAIERSLEDCAGPSFTSSLNDVKFKKPTDLSLKTSKSEGYSLIAKRIIRSSSDEDLEKALQMSLDSSLCRVEVLENFMEPDLGELRKRRLDYLDKKK